MHGPLSGDTPPHRWLEGRCGRSPGSRFRHASSAFPGISQWHEWAKRSPITVAGAAPDFRSATWHRIPFQSPEGEPSTARSLAPARSCGQAAHPVSSTWHAINPLHTDHPFPEPPSPVDAPERPRPARPALPPGVQATWQEAHCIILVLHSECALTCQHHSSSRAPREPASGIRRQPARQSSVPEPIVSRHWLAMIPPVFLAAHRQSLAIEEPAPAHGGARHHGLRPLSTAASVVTTLPSLVSVPSSGQSKADFLLSTRR